jgi:hypothetical protein
MMSETADEQHPTVVHFHNHGVTLPAWLAISMAAAFILASLTFLLTVIELRDLRGEFSLKMEEQRREIRMLQLHAQDIENVLIRAGVARRSDFAPWTGTEKPRTKEE